MAVHTGIFNGSLLDCARRPRRSVGRECQAEDLTELIVDSAEALEASLSARLNWLRYGFPSLIDANATDVSEAMKLEYVVFC